VKDIRKKNKELLKKTHNIGLDSLASSQSLFLLAGWPAVNAQLDGDSLIYHDYGINPCRFFTQGLVVPVIRNAESLSMAEKKEPLPTCS